jgi:response regulator RpfG family c-di-GMP phosphodiesterase
MSRKIDANGGRFVESNVPRRAKDGEIRYTYTSYGQVRNSFDEVIAYTVMETDLTERVRLEEKLRQSFAQIKETQSAAILGFAKLTEYRDKDTGKHLERIPQYTRVLAHAIAKQEKYAGYLTEGYIDDLCLSSILHDIGKVGVADAILLKPGKLTDIERESIRLHATLGGDALAQVDEELSDTSLLSIGKQIAYHHHERWDGGGYPKGLAGEQIPLSARIVAIADVYDALTTKRVYKRAQRHEEAVEQIREDSGSRFDPDVVAAFLQVHEELRRIRLFQAFKDDPAAIRGVLDSAQPERRRNNSS